MYLWNSKICFQWITTIFPHLFEESEVFLLLASFNHGFSWVGIVWGRLYSWLMFFCELKMTPTPFSAWKEHFSLDKVWLFGGLAVVVPLLAKEISPSGIVTLSCFVDLETMGDRCWETWEKPRRLFFCRWKVRPSSPLIASVQKSPIEVSETWSPKTSKKNLFSLKVTLHFRLWKSMVGRWHFLISGANLLLVLGRAWVPWVFSGSIPGGIGVSKYHFR